MNKEPKTWVQYDRTLPYIEDRDPGQKPVSHLVKDGENSYKVVEGRRPSKTLFVNKLRKKVDAWRDNDYPGVTDTTRELLYYWFERDHIIDGNLFKFWFCQREAIETLIYLFEVKKYDDIEPVIRTYAENFRKDLFTDAVEITETPEGKRKLIRYFPELNQEGEQDLPEKRLLRYAFKMATGSGKTFVMALIIVWSYFNRIREKNPRYADNFLIIAPNVIVYERLAKDFESNKIFYKFPFIPEPWRGLWNIKVSLRGDESPLNPSGNLIVNNIQQLYASRSKEYTPETIIDEILGRRPQKNLTKPPETLMDKIKLLDSLIIMNDEAHHVHREELKWYETIIETHNSLPDGLNLWLDFSATPKTQTGTYYPWIIVDYPLAQAVEDRIVKAPLIVHRVDRKDPEKINKENVVQKYGDWIVSAIERWKEHFKVYKEVGKKPVLFIMAEKNDYADKIADFIRKQKSKLGLKNPEVEVLVIHVKSRETGEKETEIKISDKDLPRLRRLAREIDSPENKVKIIVSNLMLREGWDVQNVTITLGLRPFTSKAQILPEQAVGRGLRLMRGISPDHTQTLEVMGTEAFEEFVRELEKEGVGINTVKTPPPLPVTIAPERSRLQYDIEIPQTSLRYTRNYKILSAININNIPSLFNSDKLEEERKILLKLEFMPTGTEVSQVSVDVKILPQGHELLSYIAREVEKRARLTACFSELYPIVAKYVLEKCFETKLDIEDEKLRKHLNDIKIQEAIMDLLSKEIGRATARTKEISLESEPIKLSKVEPFTWRRKHLRCKKTIFNFVAVYNNFEAEFSQFLDRCPDIERFSALAQIFKIDYLSSKGAIRFYYPDFIAVQKKARKEIFWIIETKGREYEEVKRKEDAIKKWCKDISEITKSRWAYLKVPQQIFDSEKSNFESLADLVEIISKTNENRAKVIEKENV